MNLTYWGFIAGGFLFSVWVGDIFISKIIGNSWKRILGSDPTAEYKWLSSVVGIIERPIFLIAFNIGKPEIIAGWLVLKTVNQWKTWDHKAEGRALFSVYIVGNGLSILFSFVGFLIIRHGPKGFPAVIVGSENILDIVYSIAIPILFLLFTCLLNRNIVKN
jgi:hypothetical protein